MNRIAVGWLAIAQQAEKVDSIINIQTKRDTCDHMLQQVLALVCYNRTIDRERERHTHAHTHTHTQMSKLLHRPLKQGAKTYT